VKRFYKISVVKNSNDIIKMIEFNHQNLYNWLIRIIKNVCIKYVHFFS